jgi:hypothetical protein
MKQKGATALPFALCIATLSTFADVMSIDPSGTQNRTGVRILHRRRSKIAKSQSMPHALSSPLARAHAAAAGVGANTAMLVHLGVLHTFHGAKPTGGGARIDHRADHLFT